MAHTKRAGQGVAFGSNGKVLIAHYINYSYSSIVHIIYADNFKAMIIYNSLIF